MRDVSAGRGLQPKPAVGASLDHGRRIRMVRRRRRVASSGSERGLSRSRC